jgi:hypothetical protein
MIVGLAGRRIGAPGDSEAPVPDTNTGMVRERLRALFHEVKATALVGSGACGADLLAMEVAGELGLKRRMVLPCEPLRFRATSVVDQHYAHNWGTLFDHVASELDGRGDLIVLRDAGQSDAAYRAVNAAILEEAMRMAHQDCSATLAVVVWDGTARGRDDLSAAFADDARARSLAVREILTAGNSEKT